MTRAVVFAYHNVGARCLKALLARQVEVPLVVTHEDNPREHIWFDSVAATAAAYGIPTIAPADPNADEAIARVADTDPDFIFSFYYRAILKARLLALPSRGALNMHGSLLPRYRGRVPINWAIIHGETETGATLHYMTEKADAGDIVAQTAVPILPDDMAKEVFDKVTVAAEMTLYASLPALIAGTAARVPQDARRASYFGGRTPEDGVIDWSKAATEIHNLVRAVAPPYPAARSFLNGRPARILSTRVIDATAARTAMPSLSVEGDRIVVRCGGGGTLAILEFELEGARIGPEAIASQLGAGAVALGH